jgi:S-DNA-T family DNA segregation ATPase FtsK/SpoIIIE
MTSMPTEITVRQVRDAIYCGMRQETVGSRSGDMAAGTATTLALGRLFHEVFAAFFSRQPGKSLLSAADDCDATASDDALVEAIAVSLESSAYREVVGPSLHRDRATLTHSPTETLALWTAVRELCRWLAKSLLPGFRKHKTLTPTVAFVDCERVLELELSDPAWSDTVVLRGAADAVLHIPGRPHSCVVELKTGKTAPEADLAQAILYHMMLGGKSGHAVGLISFKPHCEDQLIQGQAMASALPVLKSLIGRLAGVCKSAATTPGWKTATPLHFDMRKSLECALQNHGLNAHIEEQPLLGPTFVRFLVRPSGSQKVSRFTNAEDEIALAMSLTNSPMISRVGGHIAIDIERPDRHTVEFSEIAPLLPKSDDLLGNSHVLVGIDMEGQPVFADLSRPENCHMLVAGTAGSGKSIWLRSAIASLVETNTRETLQLVLIDPKRNAFTAWKDCDHLRSPIVFPDEVSVVGVLDELITEMESRYSRMTDVDDLAGLIQQEGHCIPRIVCVCDEYADLMAAADDKKEIEKRIVRLGQKARAAGIHLILATQTPRRDIIGGAIKANLPTYVALRVASAIEARIVEAPSAELLLGNGDLLFKSIGPPVRLQGVRSGAA